MITIRKAIISDVDAIIRMAKAFLRASRFNEIEADIGATKIFIETAISSDDKVIFVASDGDVIVGMLGIAKVPVCFAPESSLAQELFWWVEKDYRKKSVGVSLIIAAEDWADKVGARSITMTGLHGFGIEVTTKIYEKRRYEKLETTFIKNCNTVMATGES